MLLVAGGGVAGGCATAETSDTFRTTASFAAVKPDAPVLSTSLFTADDLVVTDEAVKTILDSRVEVPADARVAVVLLGRRPNWAGWNSDIAQASDAVYRDFLTSIESHPNVAAAEFVPQLLMPSTADIANLRLAALRMRCDMLLVYTSRTGQYEDRKLLGTDRVRAYATVEALLIDVRTGTVPATTIITDSAEAEKTRDDKNLRDASVRAQLDATAKAWMKMSGDVKAYFSDAVATNAN
ncbi:MAG: hypothetical protein AAGK78_06625 [Planctomycetota bacterium]